MTWNRGLSGFLGIVLVGISLSFSTGLAAEETRAARIIRRGDSLDIRVKGDPMLSRTYLVQDDGKIYFDPAYEALGTGISVQGKTVNEIRALVESAISTYIKEPSLTLEMVPGQRGDGGDVSDTVGVFGSFGTGNGVLQGKSLPHRPGMKILDLLMETGAILPETDMKNTRLIRGENISTLDLRELINGQSMTMNKDVLPGDKLILRSKKVSGSYKVHLMGSVAKQGTYNLPKTSSVLDLLMAGGGSIGRASVGKSFIIRVVGSKTRVLPVDIKRIIRFGDMSQNIPIRENDVLFIPETGRADIKSIINQLSDISILRDRASNVSSDIQAILGEVQNK